VTIDAQSITTLAGEYGILTGIRSKDQATGHLTRSPFSSDGFQIRLDGQFNYHIIDMRGAIVDIGEGNNYLKVGSSLTPGVYMLNVKNTIGNFQTKLVKK